MKKFLMVSLAMLMSTFVKADNNVTIRKNLQKLGMTDVEIMESPIKNIKSVLTREGTLYVSEDGKYVLHGALYEITDKGIVNLTTKSLLVKLNNLKNEMIVYPAKKEKYVITVFMDITCHYCHLLHQKIKEYNELGITVRYLAFPRAGLHSNTAKQMEAIWQSKDPVFALDEAEKGNLPKELKTPNMIQKHYELGIQFGVSGTPSIITESGEVIGGYLEPKKLLQALDIRE
ncbi:bifunctional protein-disulfide isomerase/oxidoreductase DsbC [Histophilus somni]|uniref:Thiol:disulfide interchange protein n=1 Tax=Histophilus somni TaxID=731 RepID=A0AAX2RZK8_HISSO|nr:bifunctional protein-disulfide isomerase/oxidoreductase DsbC [Histophilus somni]QEH08230.1 bifunctional protein-disulfide isomerase/oxidoreductase DsbC [Histophilus somni]QEH17289.1 bifunctional protein-disulfide isomerase/oxidoreductase DsbC [Histophilus somni]QEH27671.1 bifunctional protein-disulfide isomerase/oxidoreductase DsbC [Histophilus somni]QQF65493.1 bifunctional protein-disulfide isomerase/oxidoreductase DsbC [Histophilus somni]QQF70229.1 bifunctional protein-disulfide isomerase